MNQLDRELQQLDLEGAITYLKSVNDAQGDNIKQLRAAYLKQNDDMVELESRTLCRCNPAKRMIRNNRCMVCLKFDFSEVSK